MAKKTDISSDAGPRAEAADSISIAGVRPKLRPVAARAALFRQRDETFGVFRLVSGRIRLVRATRDGAEVAVHTVRPGELFAEASIFSSHYHCDAIALRACEVLVYPKAELVQQLKECKEDLWAFTAELAHRVQKLRSRLELGQIRAAPERVLQALRLQGAPDGSWKPEGTLKHFAEEIGLTHEALYRALATLERDGRIERADGCVRMLE